MTETAVTSTEPETDPVPPPAPRAGSAAREDAAAPPGRLWALDGLRLVAALMVAAYHLGGRGGEVSRAWGASPAQRFPVLHTYFAYGCLGVQVFFVISGFVICMSGWGRGPRAFLASRAGRLLPAYWAAVVLVTAVSALPVAALRTIPPSDALVNLTMLQQPLGADRVLGVCWTLWAEVRFYVLFALLVVAPGVTRRRVLVFCAGWTLAAAVARGVREPLLDAVLMPGYAPFFVGGVGLYLVHRDRRDVPAWGVVAASWLIGQHQAVAALWRPAHAGAFSHRTAAGIVLVVTLGFAAVAAVALARPRRAAVPWLTAAGALTFPFYLVHEHLGWPLVRALHGGLGLPPAPALALAVAALLVLAWLLHRTVERPLGPRLRRALLAPPARRSERGRG
ncbi:acyltransferase [Streptomyces sp. NPDC096080]|uniref:acyltransferase family protein n=1 Tax=Streptomyces sp. NPDC096080 TaxID=3156693 RepID=UPI0033322032